MTDDAKQAWNDVGDRFAAVGARLAQKYREAGPAAAAEAHETQRSLQDAANDVGNQLGRALDALGATIRDEGAKGDLKRAMTAVGEALAATFAEAADGIRRSTRPTDGGAPPPGDDEPGSPTASP